MSQPISFSGVYLKKIIVEIGQILNKELKFIYWSDFSDPTIKLQ